MIGPFHLKCLGEPELRGPDGKLVRFRVKKHLALLVYLAVDGGRRHDRQRLVDMLWPRAGSKQGRHSLATALSVLRSVFGRAAFPAGGTTVRFAPTDLAMDLHRLATGDILGAGGDDALEVDGFLRGFALADAPEFELWKEREHARRLPAIHAGLLMLIDHGRRRGSHDEIMRRAGRLLALDHLAEEGVRATMEALVLAGDRFSALRAFDEWKERLTQELGAEPSSLLEGMAAQLRKRGWEPKEPVAIPPVPAEQWRDRKFVGRAAEYRRLYEVWEATHQFRPRHVHIVGDSGVGKTTLAQRLVTAAGLEGASVARVQCYHLEQRLPYAAIGSLVAGLLGRPGVAATSPSALAEIARIVPRVKDHFPGLPPPRPSEGETARLLFAEGVMDLLAAVMDERPMLLVFDDYHLSDEASLAVLHLILRRLDQGRYMVVVTRPPHDEAETPQARRIREGMARLSMEPLQLHPMPEEETSQLLAVILEGLDLRPRPPEWRALVRASRGYPMALELLAQDWRANGIRSLALSLGAMTPAFGAEAVEREDAYAAVAERVLFTLSHSARQVITLAALLGSRMSDLSLFGLVDLSFGQTVEGVSELTAKRLLRSIGSSLEFIDELVRAHVYGRIPGPVRIALHAAIADRLLSMEADGTAVPGLEVAWHLMRSGRVLAATPRLFRGAAEAKERGAPDEAVLALESALPGLDPDSVRRAKVLLADLHQESGQWEVSLATIDSIDCPPADLGSLVAVLKVSASWHLGQLDGALQRAGFEELLSILARDDRAYGSAFLLAARLAKDTGRRSIMERLLAVSPSTHSDSDSVQEIVGRATLHYHLRNLDTSSALAADLTAQLKRFDRRDSAAVRLLNGAAALSVSAGDYDAAADHLATAKQIAVRLDNETLVGQTEANAAIVYLRLSRYRDAIRTGQSASTRLSAPRPCGYQLQSIEAIGIAAAVLGDAATVATSIQAGDAKIRLVVAPWRRQDWLLAKADINWLTGRYQEALDCATDATAGEFELPGDLGCVGQHARWVGRLAEKQGSYDRALERISPLSIDLAHHDTLDNVEILSTLRYLHLARHRACPVEIEEQLFEWLEKLSEATRRHAADLGIIGDPGRSRYLL